MLPSAGQWEWFYKSTAAPSRLEAEQNGNKWTGFLTHLHIWSCLTSAVRSPSSGFPWELRIETRVYCSTSSCKQKTKGLFFFAGFTLKIRSRSVLTLMLRWKHELQLWLFPAIAQCEEDNRFEERETGPGRNSEITTYLFEVEGWNWSQRPDRLMLITAKHQQLVHLTTGAPLSAQYLLLVLFTVSRCGEGLWVCLNCQTSQRLRRPSDEGNADVYKYRRVSVWHTITDFSQNSFCWFLKSCFEYEFDASWFLHWVMDLHSVYKYGHTQTHTRSLSQSVWLLPETIETIVSVTNISHYEHKEAGREFLCLQH